MAAHYLAILERVAADPDQSLSRLPLLASEQRQQILVEWNRTAAFRPAFSTIHRLFEAQAEQRPDAVAAVFGTDAITYGELNARANQLARHLQARGVGFETLVGIFMERSLEMIVALLGALKAGGAYVPLDARYPDERLEFMIADAVCRSCSPSSGCSAGWAGRRRRRSSASTRSGRPSPAKTPTIRPPPRRRRAWPM